MSEFPYAPWAALGPWFDVLLLLAGAALLVSLFRYWFGSEVSCRVAGGYLLIVVLAHGRPLATDELEYPGDIAYRVAPWAGASAPRPRPTNPLLTDVTEILLPFRALAQQRLLAGEIPLWSHELGVGQPLLANGQSAVLSPFHLFTLPLPVTRAISLTSALALLLSLLGAHLLARELGCSRTGAFLAALAIGLSTFGIAWRYYPLGLAAAHLPALAVGLMRLAAAESRAIAATSLLLASLLASGNPEPALLAAPLAAAAVLALARRNPPRDRLRFLGRCLATVLLGAALSAPAWLPLATALPESARTAELVENPALMSPPPVAAVHLATLWQPLAAGWPVDGSWTGTGQDNWNEIASGYAGLVTLALALAGWSAPGSRVRWLGIAAVASLALALPIPPLDRLLSAVPLLGGFPWARARCFWIWAIALAAGLALTRLGVDQPSHRRRLQSFLVGAGLVGVATTWVAESAPFPLWSVVALASPFGLAVLLASPRLRSRFAALATIAVAIDLLLLGVASQPRVPAELDLRPPEAIRDLSSRVADLDVPCRVSASEDRLLPYLPALYGLWDPRGSDALRPAAPLALLRARFPGSPAGQPLHFPADLDFAMLRRLGVRFLLVGPSRSLPAPWTLVSRSADTALWEDATAFQLFHVPRRVVAAGSRASALALASWNVVPTEISVVEAWELANPPSGARVDAIRAVNNGFDLDVSAPRGGLLASSVAWSPGWRVFDAAHSGRIVRVDGAFLGIWLEPGASRVALRYAPPGWQASKTLLLSGLVGLVGSIARARRQHRGRAPSRSPLT